MSWHVSVIQSRTKREHAAAAAAGIETLDLMATDEGRHD